MTVETCPGCGTILGGDTLCSIHDCQWEDVEGIWCPTHNMVLYACRPRFAEHENVEKGCS